MKTNKIILIIFLLLLGVVLIFPRKAAVIALIMGGKVIAPEASAVLSHYCFGNGDTLHLNADYVKTSPVVLKSIQDLKIGQSRWISFKQNEDWRLSYALNPFTIKRTKEGYTITQFMEFDKKGIVATTLNLGFTKIKVNDNIAHAFDCTPYLVVFKF